MSPLNSQPLRGYQDWQRVDNWDSGTLFSETSVVHNSSFLTPVMDVSRYAYIGGRDFVLVNVLFPNFNWYADQAATVLVGNRAFSLSPSIGASAQYRLPNLGPFLQINYSTNVASPVTHSCVLFGTNRFHPLEMIPVVPQLITVLNANIAAGATLTVFPAGYYSGPVRVWVSPAAGGEVFRIRTLDTANVVQFVESTTLVSGNQSFDSVVPTGFWWIEVFNGTAGAINNSFSITPTLTGAT